jgi:hypothetical protein
MNRSLNYMDYRVAYTTHTLVDDSVVDHRREYKNVNDLESDRSKITFTMTPEEVRQHQLKEIAKQKEDKKHQTVVSKRDAIIQEQYLRANKLMLGR